MDIKYTLNKIYKDENKVNSIIDEYNKVFFSIIIPCYNCETTIERLFKSLDKQEFRQFEVLVCNDRSTDNFIDYIEKYKSSMNIKILDVDENEIHGPSVARNLGLNYACGEWIIFIDSDDFISDTTLIDFYNIIQSEDINIINSTALVVDNNLNGCGELFSWSNLHGKCIKHDLIGNLRFNKFLYTNEDLYFLTQLQIYNDLKIAYKKELKSYNYVLTNGSIVHSKYFYMTCLNDFILARYEPYLIGYKENKIDKDKLVSELKNAFLAGFAFYQAGLSKYKNDKLDNTTNNIFYIKNVLLFKRLLNILRNLGIKSKDELIRLFMSNPTDYKNSLRGYKAWVGAFEEIISIKKFIESIYE